MAPGILRITEECRKTIEATGVQLHITIQGENFIFGNAAIEKCVDVKLAVESIRKLDEGAVVSVDSVVIKSDTGWFAKGSKGLYRLSVTLSDMKNINRVLAALMELKNVAMDSLEWMYDEYAAKVDLVTRAVALGKGKAESMAGAMGKVIQGIKSCSDSYKVPDDDIIRQGRDAGDDMLGCLGERKSVRRAVAAAGDFGTEVRGTKEITAVVTMEFYLHNGDAA